MGLVTRAQAVDLLRGGHIVALPTETVYGLAARIDSESALHQVFATKRRPFFDPLIVHVANLAQTASLVTDWPPIYNTLVQKFWPGPLTVIAAKAAGVSGLITAGLDSVALRCPNHPEMLAVLTALGVPLAAPSANLFGHTSPTSAAHVLAEFDQAVPVLDGGTCSVGVESTVVQARFLEATGEWEVQILRPGGISRQQLRSALQGASFPFQLSRAQSVASPGQLKAHYQPTSPLVIVAGQSWSEDVAREAARRLGRTVRAWRQLRLPPSASAAARVLYEELRRLSTSAEDAIWFEKPPTLAGEDWEAVWDRLDRAASVQL